SATTAAWPSTDPVSPANRSYRRPQRARRRQSVLFQNFVFFVTFCKKFGWVDLPVRNLVRAPPDVAWHALRSFQRTMPTSKWSNKSERQYQHIKDSARERGASTKRAEEIAART